MKKISNIKLCLSILFSASFLVSCENDDFTGASTLEVTENVTGTITFDGSLVANQTVNEVDENSYQYTISLDKPQAVDIHVRVIQIGGTADGDDYEMDEIVVIPAYSTSAVGNIKILNDCTIEGVETLDLQIGTISTSNANLTSKTVSFTINPYVSTDLDLAFNFNKDFSITGTEYTLCGIGYDVDFLILDENLNDTGIADAQTGSCIEHLTINQDLLSDGIYHIYYFVYDDVALSSTFHDPFHIPFSVDYGRCGSIDEATYTVPVDDTPLSTDGANTFGYIVTVVVNNGVYTLQNQANEIIASGRMSNFKKEALVRKLANRKK